MELPLYLSPEQLNVVRVALHRARWSYLLGYGSMSRDRNEPQCQQNSLELKAQAEECAVLLQIVNDQLAEYKALNLVK